jgi:hypothetical protein
MGDALRPLGVNVGAFTYESMLTATRGVPCDNTRTARELGVEFRPIDATIRDLLLWMHDAGHIKPAALGRLRA